MSFFAFFRDGFNTPGPGSGPSVTGNVQMRRPSLKKLIRCIATPGAPLAIQVPARWFCSGWFPPDWAREHGAVSSRAVTAKRDRNLDLVRRRRSMDWFDVLLIRFGLSVFLLVCFQAFAPG